MIIKALVWLAVVAMLLVVIVGATALLIYSPYRFLGVFLALIVLGAIAYMATIICEDLGLWR